MARDGVDAAADILLAAAWEASQRGAYALEAMVLHDLVRFGAADRVVDRLVELGQIIDGPLMKARVDHARGAAASDATLLAAAVDQFERVGSSLFVADASAQLAKVQG
ncbi:MAG TPA: hypothetical protein VMS14_03980, partial [Ilumatobacteraceae bacterium]|nr:hypothetical protein [Ilumatobacteraceae bacterium]